MITTITLNPAIDRTVELEQITLGHVNRAKQTREDLGGKSINVARLLKGYGIHTKALFFAGRDNWDAVNHYIKKDGMDAHVVLVDGKTRINTKLVEPSISRTTDINEAGFVTNEKDYESLLKLILTESPHSEYVVMSGSLPPMLPTTIYKEIGQKLKGMTKVVLDADSEALLEGLKGSPFLIKPNIHELESALKCEFKDLGSIIDGARQLLFNYDIEYALVSMGADGSILIAKDKAIKADIIPVQVKSTVGAGDAMLAGFIYSLHEGCTLEQALANGVASSALTISHDGLLTYSLEELASYAKQVQLHYV